MRTTHLTSILGFSVALVGLVVANGCKRDRGHEVGTTTTTSVEVKKMTDNAVEQIASARCQREVSCDRVGRSMRHASIESCFDLNKAEYTRELNADACPRGIDQNRLVDCIAATEQASCLDPIGTLVRVEECRSSKLCLKGVGP
jgi:hypothetical protein